jgi:hypothetical protein
MESDSPIDYVFWLQVEREIAPIVNFFVSNSKIPSSCISKMEYWLRQVVDPREQVILFGTEKKVNDPITASPNPDEEGVTRLAMLERDEMLEFIEFWEASEKED